MSMRDFPFASKDFSLLIQVWEIVFSSNPKEEVSKTEYKKTREEGSEYI